MIKLNDFYCSVCHNEEELYLDSCEVAICCDTIMVQQIGGSKRFSPDTYTSKAGDVFKEKTKRWYEPHQGLEGVDLQATKESKI